MANKRTKKNVEKNFNTLIAFSILGDVLLIIFGAVMLFNPGFTNKIIGLILGVILLVNGASLIFDFFKRDGAKIYSLNILFGILISILGLVLIAYPYSVISFVTICIGIYLIISGAVKINHAIWLKKAKEESWNLVITNGIILLVLGLLIIFNPFANLAVTQVIGIFIIVSSIIKISNTILFKNKAQDIIKIFWS